MADFLDERFQIRSRGSTLTTEIRAGVTTFMTMAYILCVNPSVLSAAGLPFDVVAFATCCTAIVGSGIVGLFGHLPFGLAPGMGLNAYFAYGVVVAKGVSHRAALPAVLIMSAVFTLLSATGACAFLQRVMPSNLKHATTVAIGIFQAFIGFRMINVVVGSEHTLVALGDVTSSEVLVGLGTTFLIGVLVIHHVTGAMLIGIGASACFSWLTGLQPLPERVVALPSARCFWQDFDWQELLSRRDELGPVMLALLFVCIFDTAGVQFGAGLQAGLVDERTGTLPGTRAAFLAASLATMAGSLLGTSPTIIHNETCAGIAEGGRTGVTALVVAAMFGLSIFFVPILAAVPLTATAPALIIVGTFMMGPAGAMDWDNFQQSLPAFLTITVMTLTYSIANGVVAGLLSHAILDLCVKFTSWVAAFREPQGIHEPLHASDSTKRLASLGTSVSSSPHAMVRDPSETSLAAFAGLSALGGRASPRSSPKPFSADVYKPPWG